MLEALSVIVQVVSFKLTGRRVFRMAPIHHHFEQLGLVGIANRCALLDHCVRAGACRPLNAEKCGDMIAATTFAGRRIALFGLGGSGLATAQSLMAGGAHVVAWDESEGSRAKAIALDIPVADLDTRDWSQFASFVLAPGVPLTHPAPHWSVLRAQAAGVEIIGDIEIFCRERVAHAPQPPFVAITGTNGKSTTTALIAHLFAAFGHDVQMGGNIGVPILSLAPPSNDRVHVIELSTFQIESDAFAQSVRGSAAQCHAGSSGSSWHAGALCRDQGAAGRAIRTRHCCC